MGRLFWKFFFFIWLAQLTAVGAISLVFWFERQQDQAHWQALQSAREAAGQAALMPLPRFEGERPPRFDGERPLPPEAGRPPLPWPPEGGPRHRRGFPVMPLFATLFASLIFAALLAWYFAKPIRSLRAAFNAAAAGNLDTRLGQAMGRRRDELSDLGRDFDQMAGQISALMASQRRLLHDVSHEMRSPLARLQAAVGLLRQRPENLMAACDRLERECGRMDKLIGELLHLARLEAGVGLHFDENIALDQLLSDLAADAELEAEAAQRRIELDCAAGLRLSGNADLLQSAIENVVRNALRYTPPDSAVGISARLESGAIHVSVCDSGPGVPEARLTDIFDAFCRIDDSGAGHGLGLAIAQRVVLAHGGSICARNRQGGGLCVEIQLPVAS